VFSSTKATFDDLFDITFQSFENLQVDPKRLLCLEEMKHRYVAKMEQVRAKLDQAQGDEPGSDRKRRIVECSLSMVSTHIIKLLEALADTCSKCLTTTPSGYRSRSKNAR